MRISVETKGNKYNVAVELTEQDKVDTYGYGVLTNNKFENLANVYERQVNDQRVLLYRDLPGKTVDDWLNEKENEFSLLTMLRSIATVTTSISTFSLFEEGLVMDPSKIFVTEKGAAKFIYIPVEGIRQERSVLDLVLEILQRVDPKTEVCSEYVETIGALYSQEDLTIDQIKATVDRLSGREEKAVVAPKEIKNETASDNNLMNKLDHSDFVMKGHERSAQEKKETAKGPQRAMNGAANAVPQAPKAQPAVPGKPGVDFGGFMVPGMEAMVPGGSKKKKEKPEKAAKAPVFPTASPAERSNNAEAPEKNAPKQKMNLTEMLIAWIKKLKEKKNSDPKEAAPAKETKKKGKKQKQPKAAPAPVPGPMPGPVPGAVPTPGKPKSPAVPIQRAPAKKDAAPQKEPDKKAPQTVAPDLAVKKGAAKGGAPAAVPPAPIKQTAQPSSNPPKKNSAPSAPQPPKQTGGAAVQNVPIQAVVPEVQQGSVQPTDIAVQTNQSNGNIQIIVNLPAKQGTDSAADYLNQLRPKLVRRKNNETIVVDCAVFKIGKEKGYVNYFISDNPHISRAHANILSKEGKYYIVDTNSTNHTFVNGKQCESNVETELKNGDIIRLANEDFTFSCKE